MLCSPLTIDVVVNTLMVWSHIQLDTWALQPQNIWLHDTIPSQSQRFTVNVNGKTINVPIWKIPSKNVNNYGVLSSFIIACASICAMVYQSMTVYCILSTFYRCNHLAKIKQEVLVQCSFVVSLRISVSILFPVFS